VLPSFPKKGPLTALVMAATALLALASTLAKELIGNETRTPVSRAQEPQAKQRQRREPTQPPRYEPAQQAASSIPASKLRPAPPPSPAPQPPESVVAVVPPARKLPVVIPEPVSARTAQPKPKPRQEPQQPTPPQPKPQAATPPASTQKEPASTPPSWQAEKPAKRPSWLQVNAPRQPQTAPETEISTWSAATAAKQPEPEPDVAAEPDVEPEVEPTPAAAGLLNRLRKEFSGVSSEPAAPSPQKAPRHRGGFLDRFRRPSAEQNETDAASKPPIRGVEMASLSPNDLRHYLTQRIATSELDEEGAKSSGSKTFTSRTFTSKISRSGRSAGVPVLKSLDAVLDKVLASATGGLPRALLVAGTSPKADATQVAINLARALVDQNEQVVLLDLAKGASAVSGPLGMPRVPGFADLAVGRASFSDVIRVDDESSMQVIPAGSPTTRGTEPEPDCFMRVFEALTQAYGCVVLHADLAAIEALMPALKFELPVMVAVLPSRASVDSQDEALSTFQTLGCPVVVYEGNGKPRRGGLFGRIAAV